MESLAAPSDDSDSDSDSLLMVSGLRPAAVVRAAAAASLPRLAAPAPRGFVAARPRYTTASPAALSSYSAAAALRAAGGAAPPPRSPRAPAGSAADLRVAFLRKLLALEGAK